MRKWSALLCLGLLGCAADPGLKQRAESVVWSAMQSGDAAERLRATRLAADLADPALDRGLPPRLVDPDARVRATAAVALASQADAALAVLARLLAGPDADARAIAVDGVGFVDDAARVLAALARDPDAGVRARVAAALARPPRGVSGEQAAALTGRLAGDADANVRAAAVRALHERAMLSLVEAALNDPALSVRLAALASLCRLDPTPVRLAALGAGSDRFVALRAAVQLAKLGDAARALEAVRVAAADPHAALRVAALNAAGELGDAGAAIARGALADRALDVRLAAARALITTGHPDEARPTLTAALPDGDAAEELARLGDPRAIELLRSGLAAPSPEARRRALSRLAPLPGSQPAVARALADRDAAVRLTAAEIVLRRAFR